MRTRALRRPGITLTEILISIMIMGVGLTAVLSLFPLGMTRLREATRDSRSTLLGQSALAEIQARNLLQGNTFSGLTWYLRPGGLPGPLVLDSVVDGDALPPAFDVAAYGADAVRSGAFAPGLPFVYDPLLWAQLHFDALAAGTPPPTPLTAELRFGADPGLYGAGPRAIRDGNNGAPSAFGLQRLTNFLPFETTQGIAVVGAPASALNGWPYTYATPVTATTLANLGLVPNPALVDTVSTIFPSPDDIVTQTASPTEANSFQGQGSPILPAQADVDGDPTTPGYVYQRDYDFTWMITARQVGAGDSSAYEGDLVIFHKRPLSLDASSGAPAGERVVEAVWGHATNPGSLDPQGYSNGDEQLVLLRWPAGSGDPRIRVGDWIADVTYERSATRAGAVYSPPAARFPAQRCSWYQIGQVISRPETDLQPPDNATGYRRAVVRVTSPLRAKTRLFNNGGNVVPVQPEAALLNNYVVNVYPQLFSTR
jgi:type II secretory pathway pseudopilin PulG